MINNARVDETASESLGELLSLGFAAAADTCSKLFNSDVKIEANELKNEKIDGLESFGEEPGVVISLNLGGALNGKAAVVMQNFYAKNILNILMNIDNGDEEEEEIDEMAMGAFKELIGQMSAAFAGALTDFFGSAVTVEAAEIYDLSEECEELAEIFGTTTDTNVYSVISDFEIKGHIEGTFNIEIDQNTFDYTIDRLNMMPGDEDESMFLNAIAGGNDPMNLNSFAQSRSTHSSSVVKDSINVQSAQFPSFSGQSGVGGLALLRGNMDLLMDVPLNVTIEIGKTRKKMRDIMEFAQGTVIDLEKQAGAPVDIVVNGQLIARGDVVVIDDNFGVRITEIVGNNAFIPKE